MPLLAIALITHVIYKAVTSGLDWGSETSRKAWRTSMEGSQRLAEQLRQRIQDRLDEWSRDSGARGYVAWTAGVLGKLAQGIGKGTLWGMLAGARGAGAVSRALGRGLFGAAGLLGAIAQGARRGASSGTDWWRSHTRNPSPLAERLANWWASWGNTVPGGTVGEPAQEPADERAPFDAGEATIADPAPVEIGASPDPEFTPEDPFGPGLPPPDPGEVSRPSFWAGEATTVDTTSVGSGTTGVAVGSGTATALLDPAPTRVIEGETPVTTVVPSQNSTAVAPITSAADGLMYEQAQSFLEQQALRAQQLASLAEQIHQLQLQLKAGAAVMASDHEAAQAALGRFNVTAPNVGTAIELLTSVAGDPATEAEMVNTYVALDAVTNGCRGDQADLQTRFGTAWEAMRAENADGQFLNG